MKHVTDMVDAASRICSARGGDGAAGPRVILTHWQDILQRNVQRRVPVLTLYWRGSSGATHEMQLI